MKQKSEIGGKLKGLYGEEYFKAYIRDHNREVWYRAEYNRIVKLKPDGGKIFDVGCGLGLFLDLFDNKKWEKYGVDISDVAVAQARTRGIRVNDYESGYEYSDESFDVIVFRGTIQHIDTPFAVIKKCIALLKSGGIMVFLSTPNSNSICYKLFGALPFLNPERNFFIPSDTTLMNVLKNFGLNIVEIRFPYLETPYARPLRDHFYFLLRCFGISVTFAFWHNIMEIYGIKP